MLVREAQDIPSLLRRLKELKRAHNYQRPEVQDMADFVGDSLDAEAFVRYAGAKSKSPWPGALTVF